MTITQTEKCELMKELALTKVKKTEKGELQKEFALS